LQLYPSSLAVLVESLKKLPGIGSKTAQRLAIHLLHAPKGEAEGLARAILDAREKIFFCSVCGNLTDKDPCDLCRDERRDQSLLCVVSLHPDPLQHLTRTLAAYPRRYLQNNQDTVFS
jgi:recombination protein RecR